MMSRLIDVLLLATMGFLLAALFTTGAAIFFPLIFLFASAVIIWRASRNEPPSRIRPKGKR